MQTPVWKTVVSRAVIGAAVALVAAPMAGVAQGSDGDVSLQEYPVPRGSHPHDVAPAADGSVWYTAQHQAALGRLDPVTGVTTHIPLGNGSRPHGVIVGPAGDAWVTDSGLNAIVRVRAADHAVARYPLPRGAANANLNTATFDGDNSLWFTGQTGVYGRLDSSNQVQVFPAPQGRGPYGIATTPDGRVYYASLAASYLGAIDPVRPEQAVVLQPPTPGQGARRVWSDSLGRLWVTGWNVGLLMMYAPDTGRWREWAMPGPSRPYAVYVDERDLVWVSDFGTNAIVRFDPMAEAFRSFSLPSRDARVRQLLGRKGEVGGAESGADKLVVIRF